MISGNNQQIQFCEDCEFVSDGLHHFFQKYLVSGMEELTLNKDGHRIQEPKTGWETLFLEKKRKNG